LNQGEPIALPESALLLFCHSKAKKQPKLFFCLLLVGLA